MRSPFAVNISSILGKSGRIDAEATAELDGLQTSGSHVAEGASVGFRGHIEAIAGGLVAEGEVTSVWVGECRRCLGAADGEVAVRVRELFEKVPTEGETYGMDGDYADLEALVREAVMLELPVAPICRPDCAGLCPVCGVNRNEVDCGHTVEVTDDRWAALDQLRQQ